MQPHMQVVRERQAHAKPRGCDSTLELEGALANQRAAGVTGDGVGVEHIGGNGSTATAATMVHKGGVMSRL